MTAAPASAPPEPREVPCQLPGRPAVLKTKRGTTAPAPVQTLGNTATMGLLGLTRVPTCGEDLGRHGQQGVGHHGLRMHGDVQLACHVAVHAGPNQLQLVPCTDTQAGQRWSHLPDPDPLSHGPGTSPLLGPTATAGLGTPSHADLACTGPPPDPPLHGPWGQGAQTGAVFPAPRPDSVAHPFCRVSPPPPTPARPKPAGPVGRESRGAARPCLMGDSRPTVSCPGGRRTGQAARTQHGQGPHWGPKKVGSPGNCLRGRPPSGPAPLGGPRSSAIVRSPRRVSYAKWVSMGWPHLRRRPLSTPGSEALGIPQPSDWVSPAQPLLQPKQTGKC